MNSPSRTAPDRELLLGNHEFPGEYVIKAFGPAGPAFEAAVISCAHRVVGEQRCTVARRATRSGHKVCVTLTLAAEAVEEVEAVYENIHRVDGLMLIL